MLATLTYYSAYLFYVIFGLLWITIAYLLGSIAVWLLNKEAYRRDLVLIPIRWMNRMLDQIEPI